MSTERRGQVAAQPHPYRNDLLPVPDDGREVGPRYATFRTHLACPGCARPVPVNEPTLDIECPFCSTEIEVEAERFISLLDAFEDDHAELRREQRTVAVLGGGLQCVLGATDADAYEGLRGVAVPAWIREQCPTVTRVWVTRPTPAADGSSIGFSCPSCATGLAIDANSPRVMHCSGCQQRVFVPEPLWQAVHGPVRIETWVVEFIGENRFDEERRMDAERALRASQHEERIRNQKAADEAKEQAEVAAALAHDLGRLGRQGRVITIVHAAVVAFALAVPWVASRYAADAAELVLWYGGATFAVYLMGVVGLSAGGRMMRRATGHHDLTFPLWFNYVFVVAMPVIGHLLGFEAMYGLRWGRYAKDYGRSADLAALNWAIISVGGLLYIASIVTALVV